MTVVLSGPSTLPPGGSKARKTMLREHRWACPTGLMTGRLQQAELRNAYILTPIAAADVRVSAASMGGGRWVVIREPAAVAV
jgi:hypothetical protein